jgi:hypothetical protein
LNGLALTQKFPGIQTDEFVVMPNHFHGILILPPSQGSASDADDDTPRGSSIPQIMQWFKAMTEVVLAGHARWKVENENNNTLKTKGYNLEHNFGHGKQHLSSLLATLNILSLLFHTGLELLDQKYKLLRSHLSTRKTFFDDLRALTHMYFDSWEHLLTFMLEGLELEIPPNTS